jgi:chemotaxis protein histidine kinase CheA
MRRYLLCRVGEGRLALPLALVRRLVSADQVPRQPAGAGGGGEPPTVRLDGAAVPLLDLSPWNLHAGRNAESMAVLEEKGLTVGLFIDKITGIRDEKTVQRYEVPGRLAGFCRGVSGLVQSGDDLYLLLDPAGFADPDTEPPQAERSTF